MSTFSSSSPAHTSPLLNLPNVLPLLPVAVATRYCCCYCCPCCCQLLPLLSGTKKRGFLEGGFCKSVHLSWLWHSECQMYCWGQYPWVFFISLAVTLDSTEAPFAKTPFSWFLTLLSLTLPQPAPLSSIADDLAAAPTDVQNRLQ